MRSHVLIPLVFLALACSARGTRAPDGGPSYDPALITVPFLVDDHFVPSGCIGDCSTSVALDEECQGGRAAADAQGRCHHFTYTASAGALGWAGVLWQTVEQNWGAEPGRDVAPGATAVHFYAKSSGPAQPLTILIGGVNAADGGKSCTSDDHCASRACEHSTCSEPHHDTLSLSQALPIPSGVWQPVTIPLSGMSYAPEVMSGFGWTAVMAPGQQTIEFCLDDLRWE